MSEHCIRCGKDEAKYMVGGFTPVHRHCGRILQAEAENAKRTAERTKAVGTALEQQDDSDLWDGVGGGGPLPEDRLMPPSVEVLENIAQIILRSKNHWMDRAVKAEKEVTRLRSAINEALDSAAGDSLHRHPISEELREYWVILSKALETGTE